jgi:hypothetical protein
VPLAFLDEAFKAILDEIVGIVLAQKIELPFEAKLEQSGCHAHIVWRG